MNDKLEKFIKSNRADMDNKEPRPDLWIDIANEISSETKQRSISKSFVWWRAAAVLLLLVTSLLVLEKYVSEPEKEVVVMNEQLKEAETYYFELISQKQEEVMALSKEFNMGEEFATDINTLDSMYSVLKGDMQHGNEENVVDAMILNLQLRIEILNQQLNIIQSIEDNKNENISEDETIRL